MDPKVDWKRLDSITRDINYVARDENGHVFGFQVEPEIDYTFEKVGFWGAHESGGFVRLNPDILEFDGPWQDSLAIRPGVTSAVSIAYGFSTCSHLQSL